MVMKGWKRWAVGSVAGLTMLAGGLALGNSAFAADADPPVAGAEDAQAAGPGGFDAERADRGFGRYDEMPAYNQALLAEALGISEEQLEAAQESAWTMARDEALAEAVANGDITQEEADSMKELGTSFDDRAMGRGRVDGPLRFGWDGDSQDAYLAEALGITVEELQAARETAQQSGLAQAVADEEITQEQADQYLTEQALQDYVQAELESALASAVEKAVADGIVTQEQADAYLEQWQGIGDGIFPGRFFGDMQGEMRDNDFGGRPRGRDGFSGGMWDDAPDADQGQMPGNDFGRGRGGMRDGSGNGMGDGFGRPDTESTEQTVPDTGTSL